MGESCIVKWGSIILAGRPIMESAKTKYLNWKLKQPEVACLFARLLALRPSDHGVHIVEIQSGSDAARLAKSINEIVSKAIGDADTHALTIIMPNLIDPKPLLEAALILGNDENWNCSIKKVVCEKSGENVTVSLSRWLRRADGVYVPSDVLVLAPFDSMPPTRRAPVAGLELFVGVPPPTDAISGKPTGRANLAHIDARLPTQEAFDKMAERTAQNRRTQLSLEEGQEDRRAKAKVSFSINKRLAESKGVLND